MQDYNKFRHKNSALFVYFTLFDFIVRFIPNIFQKVFILFHFKYKKSLPTKTSSMIKIAI